MITTVSVLVIVSEHLRNPRPGSTDVMCGARRSPDLGWSVSRQNFGFQGSISTNVRRSV
jgi:hypothetical protein